MITAALILILSAGLFLFYLQALCEKILRREFAQPYFLYLARQAALEFPALREQLATGKGAVTFARLRLALKCDFAVLSYLLSKSSASGPGISWREHLLLHYARVMFVVLGLLHSLRLPQEPTVRRLTAVLQYFGNVVGQQEFAPRPSNIARPAR